MKNSIYLILFLISASLLFSCNRQKVERLEAERARLQADSLTKDSILNAWFTSFNDIEDNLVEITSRAKYIGEAASMEKPEDADVRDRIRTEIATINEIMIENEQRIEQLRQQLKASNIKINALEETLSLLSKRIDEKDTEIAGLKEELRRLNIEIQNLDKTITQLRQENEAQEELLQQREQTIDQANTVLYVIGTTKYLKDNEIIERTGFLGTVKQLNDKVETGLFTAADMRELTAIAISSEKAGLVTVHPEGSYEFIQEGKVITSLNIINPREFWKASRFCVVETK